MNIWNKVLLGLIFVVSLAFFYFALQTLKVHKYWKTSVQKHEAKITQLPDEIEQLKYGRDGQSGLKAVRTELYKYLIARSRVWRGCKPEKVINPQTGEVQIAIETEGPHGIDNRMTLFVFEETPQTEGGRYLGEFKVQAVAEKGIGLAPAMQLTAEQLARLTQTQGTLTLCELMPADSHELMTALGEEALRKQLPPSVVDEYLNDGKEGQLRQLRDYDVLLKVYDHKRAVLTELEESVTRQKTFVETSLADAKVQVDFRKKQIDQFEQDLKRMHQERDAALAYQKSLETELASRQAKIDELIKKNRAMAASIAKMQEEAAARWSQQLASEPLVKVAK